MIVTDLDRTLLRSDKTISAYSAEILARCKKKGCRIVFATARPKRAVYDYLKQVGCDGVIFHNGAVICTGDTVCQKHSIPPDTAKDIVLSVLSRWPEANLSVEIDEFLYANYDVSVHWENVTAQQTDFSDLPHRPVDKVVVSLSIPGIIEQIGSILPEDVYAEVSESIIAMILIRQATKLNGIRALLETFGIGLSETIAFGDDYNDLSMIRACGTGVAVANALEEVRQAADFICDTNDNDGVARFLEKHILS
jgi:Cof subfamily protein (haloacid dehalogenase superfamily)